MWKREGKTVGKLSVDIKVDVSESVTELRETINGYLRLLDSIRDPEARQLIKQQLTDLQDLEFKLFNGEK